MKLRTLIATAICAAGMFASSAFATPIDYFVGSLTTSNSTQLGRPSRGGTAQSWTHVESYQGVINPAVTYYYATYTYNASLFTGAPYVDISVFDESNTAQFFVSAYSGSYDPNNRAANWLGDVGSSGNITFFSGDPGDPRYFDVVLPTAQNLVLVVNSTAGGTAGLGSNYDIAINAFADTQYTDAPVAVTPEPSTLIELGTGMIAMLGVARRRFRVAA